MATVMEFASPAKEFPLGSIFENLPGVTIEQNILRGQTETQLDHGQGLGLWFVYWTVARSNGRITVSVNDGTAIRVWLHSEETQKDGLQRYLSLPNGNGGIHEGSLSDD